MTNAKKTFPSQLHDMLKGVKKDGDDDIISWNAEGTAFTIHKISEFESTVLSSKYFKCKYRSFQRQLNGYGFERVSGDKTSEDYNGWFHPCFVRESTDLCNDIIHKSRAKLIFKEKSRPKKKKTIKKAIIKKPRRKTGKKVSLKKKKPSATKKPTTTTTSLAANRPRRVSYHKTDDEDEKVIPNNLPYLSESDEEDDDPLELDDSEFLDCIKRQESWPCDGDLVSFCGKSFFFVASDNDDGM